MTHPRSRSHPRRRSAGRLLPLLVPLAALATSCGSDPEPAAPAPTGVTPVASAAADPAPVASVGADPSPATADAPATAAAPATDGAAGSSGGGICATLPPLESIAAALGETPGDPLDLGDALIESCQVAGETGSVDFERTDAATGQDLIDLYEEQGVLVEFSDPALPGAVAGANVVQVVVGDAYYAVQVVTLASVVAPDTPEALAASAGLLREWLAVLGVA